MDFFSLARLDSLGRSDSMTSLDVSLVSVNLDENVCSSGSEDVLYDCGVHLDIDIEDGRYVFPNIYI